MAFYVPWADAGAEPPRQIAHRPDTVRRLMAMEWESAYRSIETVNGEYLVMEGLMVARHTTTGKVVPYSQSAAYGAGSDTMIGILDERLTVTHGLHVRCTPVYAGEINRRWLYELGEAIGSIPGDLATDLPNVHLKPEYTS